MTPFIEPELGAHTSSMCRRTDETLFFETLYNDGVRRNTTAIKIRGKILGCAPISQSNGIGLRT
jgi:hypothetical protein